MGKLCYQILIALGVLAFVFSSACARKAGESPVYQVNSEGYLGSDELLARANVGIGAAQRVLAALPASATTPTSVCPLPPQNHPLYAYVANVTPEQQQIMMEELTTPSFRDALSAALNRLDPSKRSPSPEWQSDEEARVEDPIPTSGKVELFLNGAQISSYAIPSWVRVVVHEALHVARPTYRDSQAYRAFSSYLAYANYIGGCLGVGAGAVYRLDGHYRAVVNGMPVPMMIRLLDDDRFYGYLGAHPGGSGGRRFFTGSVANDLIRFQLSGGDTIYEGVVSQTPDEITMSGDLFAEGTPNVRYPWSAQQAEVYFSEVEFDPIHFASRWLPIVRGDLTFVDDQVRGKTLPAYNRPRNTASFPPNISISFNYRLMTSTSAGLLMSNPTDTDNSLMLNIGKLSATTAQIRAFKTGTSGPFATADMPNQATAVINGEMSVEDCGTYYGVFHNASLILQISKASVANLPIDFVRRSGFVLGGTDGYVTNYVVREPLFCPN